MQEKVVIVGGGIGGLTAGALLAKNGFNVQVLEGSREWGGCAGKFQRQSFIFPVGATLGMGFEYGGIHDRILRYLKTEVETKSLDIVMKIHTSHRTFMYYQNRTQHLLHLQTQFPHKKREIAQFYQHVQSIAREIRKLMQPLPTLPPMTLKEWLTLFSSLSPTSLKLVPLFSKLMRDLLHQHGLLEVEEFVHFIDGQLIDSMQTTSKNCSLLMGCLALDIYHEGAFYVKGGLYKLAEALKGSIETNGGHTLLGRKVVAVHRKKKEWMVQDHRGNEYSANHLICNIPIHNLKQVLEPNVYDALPNRLKQKASLPQWGTFTMYMAIEEEVLPENIELFHQVLASEAGNMTEGDHIFLSLSDKSDEWRAPKGMRTLTASTHIDLTNWEDKALYEKQKREMQEKMLKMIKTVIPDLNEGVIHQIPGAPKAWERFTSRVDGGVGGFPQTIEHTLFKSISHRTGMNGLWLCGDTIFPGAGTIGVSVSGYHVFQSISNQSIP
ncbi:FAD-dependent oxidoreductase [Metabacillus iocasae]|uniref:C-3',4' desaturase CrtD n=1 Tax=Priestia iocasae TaxID=2291674 RepID=A0ABS2QS04_9BACI|nr:FAD-dependent oxidoreductase [Metabacillus iocasae]MBM7702185.1 C-3',4' desaturase CrtD [Metabacillus iocasae]